MAGSVADALPPEVGRHSPRDACCWRPLELHQSEEGPRCWVGPLYLVDIHLEALGVLPDDVSLGGKQDPLLAVDHNCFGAAGLHFRGNPHPMSKVGTDLELGLH